VDGREQAGEATADDGDRRPMGHGVLAFGSLLFPICEIEYQREKNSGGGEKV